MADQKKVIRELRDVQQSMKRLERRISTSRLQAAKLPSRGDDESEESASIGAPKKPKVP